MKWILTRSLIALGFLMGCPLALLAHSSAGGADLGHVWSGVDHWVLAIGFGAWLASGHRAGDAAWRRLTWAVGAPLVLLHAVSHGVGIGPAIAGAGFWLGYSAGTLGLVGVGAVLAIQGIRGTSPSSLWVSKSIGLLCCIGFIVGSATGS